MFRSVSVPSQCPQPYLRGKLAVIISPRPHIDSFVPSCLFPFVFFFFPFFLVSFLFLSFSCPLPFFFPVLLSVSSFSFPRDVWQKTSRPRTGMRVQKQKKDEKSGKLCWHWACFLLRADVMLADWIQHFFVWIALFPKVIFYFGLSG